MSASRTASSRRSNSPLARAAPPIHKAPPLAEAITMCPLCNDQLEDPRLLQCFHSFCLSCLRQCDLTNKPPEIQCPVCTFVTRSSAGLDRLPKNYFAAECVRLRRGERSCQNCEMEDATQYCKQCSSMLCAPCSHRIHHHPIFKKHEVVLVVKRSDNNNTINSDDSPLTPPPHHTATAKVADHVGDEAGGTEWADRYEVTVWSAATGGQYHNDTTTTTTNHNQSGVGSVRRAISYSKDGAGNTTTTTANLSDVSSSSRPNSPSRNPQKQRGAIVTRLTCAKHASNELTIFCHSCKEAVCNLCVPEHTSQRHRLQALEAISSQIQRYQIPALHTFLDTFQQRAEMCAGVIQHARDETLRSSYKQAVQTINTHFDELAEAITQRRQQLVRELNEVYVEKQERLSEQEAMLRSQEYMAVLSRVHSASLILNASLPSNQHTQQSQEDDGTTSQHSFTSDITVRKLRALEGEWQTQTAAFQDRRERHQHHPKGGPTNSAVSTVNSEYCESSSPAAAAGSHSHHNQLAAPTTHNSNNTSSTIDPVTMKGLLSYFNVFPSNSGTPSVVCDVGGSCSQYELFLRSLEASDEPCVDLDIHANFEGGEDVSPTTTSATKTTADSISAIGATTTTNGTTTSTTTAAVSPPPTFSHAWLTSSLQKGSYGRIECRRGGKGRTFPLPPTSDQAKEEMDNVVDGKTMTTTVKVDPRRGVLYCIGCNGGRRLYVNPALSGAVSVYSSSIGVGRREQVVGPGPAAFCTLDQPDSFVEVSLVGSGMAVRNFQGISFYHGVLPTTTSSSPSGPSEVTPARGQSSSSGGGGAGGNYIRNWVVLGLPTTTPYRPPSTTNSVDGWRQAVTTGGWVLLQEHQGDTTLSTSQPWGVWGCGSDNTPPPPPPPTVEGDYHAFRVQITGRNSSQCNHLMLSGLEVFGTAVSSSSSAPTTSAKELNSS